MYKILVYGDLDKIHNVFGVYNSETNKVDLCSWLDIVQDIKFDGVKYLNLGLTKEKKIVYVDKYNRIPSIRDEYNSKKHVYVVYKIKGTNLIRSIVFPEIKLVTSSTDDLIQYCDVNNANRLNFDIRRHPTMSIVALHKNGIPSIDKK